MGPRLVVTVGGVILGSGYILVSRITNLWGLYLSYGIIVALGSSAMYVPLVSMVTRWFPRKRGLMVGIGVSGIGFGISVVSTIASHLMISFNWHNSLLIVGGASIILIAGLAQLLKTKPDLQFAAPGGKEKSKAPAHAPSPGLSFNEAIKTSQFWMIFFAWLLYGFFYQIGAVHIIPNATDLGMSALAAAALLTIIGLIGILGRYGLGFVGNKLRNNVTLAIGFILVALVVLAITISGTVQTLYVYAVVYGLFPE